MQLQVDLLHNPAISGMREACEKTVVYLLKKVALARVPKKSPQFPGGF